MTRAAVLALSLVAACSTGAEGPICAEGRDRCEANRFETCNDDGTTVSNTSGTPPSSS